MNAHGCERDGVIQIEGTYFYIGNKQLVENNVDIPILKFRVMILMPMAIGNVGCDID